MRAAAKTNEQPLRVVIADDHAIFRDGLRRLLEDPGLQVIGQAQDGMEAATLVRQLTPDILLLDLAMLRHTGLEALRELKKSRDKNQVRIRLLMAAAEAAEIVDGLQFGACGLVIKASATEVLLTAIETVMAGGCWVGLQRVPNLFAYLQSQIQAAKRESRAKTFGLTPRQLQIIAGVVAGMENKEIASHFKIAEDTVKHHMSNIFDRLGVSSRTEMAFFAVNHHFPLPRIE